MTPPDQSAGDFSRRTALAKGAGACASLAIGGFSLVGTAGSHRGDATGSAAQSDDSPSDVEFHCSVVQFNHPELGSARVTFLDGSYVEAQDGTPPRLGSPGRIVATATLNSSADPRTGTTIENPDTDCDPGQQATTFTCESVTIGADEFRGGPPSPNLVLAFALHFTDGTVERREVPIDPTGTFRGTGENQGKSLAAVRLAEAGNRTVYFFRNPNVDS